MAEFLLEGAALKEFDVVDQQNVDGADLVLEGDGVAGLQRFGEAVHEAFRRQVEQLALELRCRGAKSSAKLIVTDLLRSLAFVCSATLATAQAGYP